MSSMNPASRPGHEQRAASNETSVDCGEPTMAWVRHIFAARPVDSAMCATRPDLLRASLIGFGAAGLAAAAFFGAAFLAGAFLVGAFFVAMGLWFPRQIWSEYSGPSEPASEM